MFLIFLQKVLRKNVKWLRTDKDHKTNGVNKKL